MGEGTLDHDKFVEYMIQDSIYLRDYLKIFAYAIAKAPNWADMQLFNGMLAYCDDGENKTRLDILASVGMTDADIDKTEMKRQCRDYCAFLKDWGEKGTQAEIIMAMLPCMWGYRYVFEQLVAKHPEALEHPDFGPVIADYVNAGYAWYCDYWYGVTNEKCKAFDDATLAHLKNIFREASAHELWFWQMAGGAD
ncbi:MAG: transcriptional regulator [Acutalibacteraceae bacterium]|nr:transcriptional regulator [Acutalibacteraceae bacterium]